MLTECHNKTVLTFLGRISSDGIISVVTIKSSLQQILTLESNWWPLYGEVMLI